MPSVGCWTTSTASTKSTRRERRRSPGGSGRCSPRGRWRCCWSARGPTALRCCAFAPRSGAEALECYLAELYVVPGRRGQGLGRALMKAAIDAARGAAPTTWTSGLRRRRRRPRALREPRLHQSRGPPGRPGHVLLRAGFVTGVRKRTRPVATARPRGTEMGDNEHGSGGGSTVHRLRFPALVLMSAAVASAVALRRAQRHQRCAGRERRRIRYRRGDRARSRVRFASDRGDDRLRRLRRRGAGALRLHPLRPAGETERLEHPGRLEHGHHRQLGRRQRRARSAHDPRLLGGRADQRDAAADRAPPVDRR